MFDDDEYIEDYSYQELKIIIDDWWNSLNDWWNSLNEEQKHYQNINPDPTFEMYILSSMNKTQSVTINHTKNDYKIYPTLKKVRNEKLNNILNG